jgi:xanthine/uracil/vitamin C permease (AzgA family)
VSSTPLLAARVDSLLLLRPGRPGTQSCYHDATVTVISRLASTASLRATVASDSDISRGILHQITYVTLLS